MKKHPCTNCGTVDPEGQWWYLKNYFKINGFFCPKCYDMVRHDSYDRPRDSEAYLAVLLKQAPMVDRVTV